VVFSAYVCQVGLTQFCPFFEAKQTTGYELLWQAVNGTIATGRRHMAHDHGCHE
jgi:hypothetical protein